MHGFKIAAQIWTQAQSVLRAWWRIAYLGAAVGVLLLSPSTYQQASRQKILGRLYVDTVPILLGFTLLAALICLVITRIVVMTALTYGLSHYALEMVIRVLVLELIPLTAAIFVAMRCTIPGATGLALLRHSRPGVSAHQDLLRQEVLPRVVAGLYASVTLAVLSCVVASLTVYVAVYGLNMAGLVPYTRMFGQVFTPAVTLLFAVKTGLFSLAISLIPAATSLYTDQLDQRLRPGDELNGLARMFAVLLLIELGSLMGNYY